MTSTNVLVVALEPIPEEKIRTAVQSRKEVADISVHVVAPATGASALQWLTGAEDEARAEAEQLAERTADAVEAEVETEVGDRDAIVAVEDALRTFPADEIVLAGAGSAKTEAALRRFGLPVSRLDGGSDQAGDEAGSETLAREVARGRDPQTPIVLIAIVGGIVIGIVVLVSLIGLLVYWLA